MRTRAGGKQQAVAGTVCGGRCLPIRFAGPLGSAAAVFVLIILGSIAALSAMYAFQILMRVLLQDEEKEEEERTPKSAADDELFVDFSRDRPTSGPEDELPAGLKHIAEEALEQAWAFMQAATAEVGTRLIEQDDQDSTLAWVVYGELEVLVGDVQVAMVGPDEILGEMALFGDGHRGAAVVAASPVRLVLLDAEGYASLRSLGNPVAWAVEHAAMEGIGSRLRAMSQDVLELSTGVPIDELVESAGFVEVMEQWLDEAARVVFEPASGNLLEVLANVVLFMGGHTGRRIFSACLAAHARRAASLALTSRCRCASFGCWASSVAGEAVPRVSSPAAS